MVKPTSIRELRDSGYTSRSVKQELRDNLIARLRKGEGLFAGIVGYEQTVVPQIENAVLSGQDIVFLGERGQAKTRMARLLVNLLDEEMPALAGCEISDDPFAPICTACRQRVAEQGEKTAIAWIPRDRRYGEKLATPDITIADLIGEVDPIKVAEGRYLSDELTIHYGLLPRTNRGRIITPLKDRFGSQIRTHYPRKVEDEIAIMEAERSAYADAGVETRSPQFMKELVAEVTHLARRSPEISQRSGVSVRVTICNYENLLSSALKRAIRLGETVAAPRVSDLGAIVASTGGKIEMESLGDTSEDKVLGKLMQRAVLNVFNRTFASGELDEVVGAFQDGLRIEVSDAMPAELYLRHLGQVRPLQAAVRKLGAQDPGSVAAAVEFVLEGLHLSKKLNKDVQAGQSRYRGA